MERACICAKFLPLCPILCDLWTVAHQVPLSMVLSRQECWSGLPCPPLGDIPDPGIKPMSSVSLALASGFFFTMEIEKQMFGKQMFAEPAETMGHLPFPSPVQESESEVAQSYLILS